MKTIKTILILVTLLITAIAQDSLGANITSKKSGNWSSSGTWNGGVIPSANDHVTIKAGHTITVNSARTASSINLESSNSRLVIDANLTLLGNLTANSNSTVTVNDSVVLKRLILNSGVVFTMNADVTLAEIVQNSGSTMIVNCNTLTIDNSISGQASNVVFMYNATASFQHSCCGTVRFTNRGKITANSNVLNLGNTVIENGSIDIGQNPNEYNNVNFTCGLEFNNGGTITIPGCKTFKDITLTNTLLNPGTCATITGTLKLNAGGDLTSNGFNTWGNNSILEFNRDYTITSSSKAWPQGTGSNVPPVVTLTSGTITTTDSVTLKRRINLLGGVFGTSNNKLRVGNTDTVYTCGGVFGSTPSYTGNVVQIDCNTPVNCGNNHCAPEITSVKSGDWNDPTVWDLGRVPGPCDDVHIDHSDRITVPSGYVATCRDIHSDNGSRLYVYGVMNCRDFYGDNNGQRTYVYGQWNGCTMYLDNGCRVYACENIHLSNCTNKSKVITIKNGARFYPLGNGYCTGTPKISIEADSANVDLSDLCNNLDIQNLSISYGNVTFPSCLTIHGVVTIDPGASVSGSTPTWASTSSLVVNRVYTFTSTGNNSLLWPNGTNVPPVITLTSNVTVSSPKIVKTRINVIDSTVSGGTNIQVSNNATVYICGGQFASAPQYGTNVTTQYCDVLPGNPPAVIGNNMPPGGFTGDLIISTDVKLGANVTVAGNIIVNSTGVLYDSTFNVTQAQSVTVDSGATVYISKSGGLTGGNSLFGTIPTNLSCGSTVVYQSNSGSLEIDPRMDYGNVTLDGSAPKSFAPANYGICGDLLITPTSGSVTMPVESNIILAGNVDQSVITSFPTTVYDVTCSGTGTKQISGEVRLTGTLQVDPGVTLITGNQLTLTSTGTRDAVIGPLVNGADIQGTICWERFIPGGSSRRRWRFLAMPIWNQTFKDAWQDDIFITGPGTGGRPCDYNTTSTSSMIQNSNGFDRNESGANTIFVWNEPTGTWNTIQSAYDTINPLKAYRTYVRGARYIEGCLLLTLQPDSVSATLIDACGPLVKFDQSINLTRTPNTGGGWNYISNPYPCPVDWNNANWAAARAGFVDPTLYVYDPATGQYNSWHPVAGSVNGGSNIIGKDQSFFIRALQPYTMTFKETYKIDTLKAGFFGKSKITPMNRLAIKLTGAESNDETVVYMARNATNTYDINYDGYKFGYTAGSIAVAKKTAPTTKLGFAAYPVPTRADTIRLFTNLSNSNASFTLTFEGLAQTTGFNYYLRDNYLNVTEDINGSNNTYTFNVVGTIAASYNQNRFELITINTASLPVVLTGLKGIKTGTSATINWTTTTEINNSHFVLENSTDGVTFKQIATIKGKGNSNEVNHYQFVHEQPQAVINYYRLRQVDYNGDEELSHTIQVNMSAQEIVTSGITVYPVPAKDQLTIAVSGLSGQKIQVSIVDLLGKTLYEQSIMISGDKINMDIDFLKQGTYFVNLSNTVQQIGQSKFIKQ